MRIWPAKAAMAAIATLDGRPLLGQAVHLTRHLHSTDFTSNGTVSGRPWNAQAGAMKIELIDD